MACRTIKRRLFVTMALGMAVWLSVAPVQAASSCAASLQFAAMNREWAKSLYHDIQAARTRVAIVPFSPVLSYSQVPPYLPYAFPVLLADYWQPGGGVTVADWRLTNQALRAVSGPTPQPLTDAQVFDIGEQVRVQYVIAGSFDIYQERIKVYVRYYDVAKKTVVKKAALTVASNLDAAFFRLIGEIAQGAAKAFPKTTIDKSLYDALIRSSSRYDAFTDFMQGVVAMSVYDADALSVAKVWLKNAIGKDYRFHQAYRELARAHYMSALITKERLANPSADYLLAEQYVTQAVQYAPKGARPQDTLARYAAGKVEFSVGANAFGRGDHAAARVALEKVRTATPEDGLNHYYLALTYQSLALDALAHEPMAVAVQINPCFKTAGIGLAVK